MNTRYRRALILVFTAGAVFRLVFWLNGFVHLPVGSDEAILGLMAREVFSGRFPLMIWVQPHGGALETYLTAPLYFLFGAGNLTLRFFPLAYSAVFMWLIYLIGRDFFGKKAGIISAALVIVPPVYISILGSLGISMNLPAFIGSAFIVYVVHRAVRFPMDADRRLLFMMCAGLVAGLTFWVHLLVACAVASAFVFLFLDDKFFFVRKHFFGFLLCFALGAFPLLVFNLRTDFSTFRMAPARDISSAVSYLRTCLVFTLPRAWGYEVPTYIDSPHFLPVNRVFAVLYGAAALALAALGAARRFRGARFFFKRGSCHPDGAWLLVSLSVICILVFARGSRSNAHSIRYIIYTFIGMLPLIGCGLSVILRKNKLLFYVLLLFMLFFHLHGSIMLMRAWANPLFTEEKLNLPRSDNLVSFLEREGITRGYMHYWLSYPVVFVTDGAVIMSPAYDERFGRYIHPYLADVESYPEPAYAFHPRAGLSADWFRAGMSGAGGYYKETGIDNFTVFYRFRAPFEGGVRPADREDFSFSASHNEKGLAALEDADENTRWGSASPQKPGMFVEVDTGRARPVAGVEMSFGRWGHDFPRGADILLSADGEKWVKALSVPSLGGSVYWAGVAHPRIFIGGDSYRFLFSPVYARMVRVVQTGAHNVFDWSIVNLEILEADNASLWDSEAPEN